MKRGLALTGAVDRERGHAAGDERRSPGMELLLAGIEPGQQDRDRRTRVSPRLAQPSGYLDAPVGGHQPLQRRIEAWRGRRIAPDHAIVCGPELVRMTSKQVLAAMIIDRGAD